MTSRPPRILVLTTDIGEGHDLPARQLAAALAEEAPGTEVAIVDGLEEMGGILSAVLKDNSRAVIISTSVMTAASSASGNVRSVRRST